MASLTELIGEKVKKGAKDEVPTSQFEGSGKVLGIYFSAHWCPPCRAFTPQLAKWYKDFKEGPNGSNFDIVFVSSDRDESSFDEYFSEMPWHAVPFSDRERKATLSRKFKITGIPSLVFVSGSDGHLITSDGRSIVVEDTEGKEFPWTPKPVSELISGDLLTKEGKTTWSDVKGEVDAVGIYFSAHWCGPCRAFTPQLVKTYEQLKKAGKKFEIIFCSSDRDEDSFKEYFESMPWLALPYGDPRKKSLSRVFDVSGIPTLVILDKEGKTITGLGRAAVSSDPEGKEFPWYPKPVNKLTGMSAGDINDAPSIVWFTDGKEESTAAAQSALLPVAQDYISKCKETNAEQEVLFFYTDIDEDDDIPASLRSFAKLPEKNPLLTLVDIPEQMVYVVDDDQLSETNVRDLLEGYQKKTITGRPLKQ